jgi:HEPN domain-containing protein
MDRFDLQRLTNIRLREARALLWSGNYCGAYYLAGYAIECALKACIARETKEFEFPDKKRANEAFEHSPEKLIKTAKLDGQLNRQLNAEPNFVQYWQLIKAWSVESRYETTITQAEARDLITAVEDPVHGVLAWLQKYW